MCHKAVPAKGGNTSNLFSHLREHHPTLFACLTPTAAKKTVTQQTIESSVARGTKFSRDSPQHKELTHAIAYHIGKDGVPLSTVERPGFKHMIHKLNPKYDLPSRKYFSNEAIPRLYT
uniref:BED-type domain-containing protein n=1 Tax=Amphimedon queenslandica TaxID=400682 RepID=A0A1X7TB10_AMPQE